ncbi:RagB/SusD family nutrient uptake outer membrane protein [Flavobacterium sp. 5]|uniref:RagB/SusD family nutrient uptake outer membrane protein n=1 Tax=Flavobacterium sp. 5 TaxID=2035199 RepID=UPI000C2C78A1|nr:RagB/SusD family nutrient uptake outer membrane protein [Flavobacterium sp. 5]
MKKVRYFFFLTVLTLGFSGCSDFLDLEPQGSENSANYFDTQENGVRSIVGIYDMLQLDEGAGPDGQWMAHHNDFIIGDIRSDDAEKGSNDGDFTTMWDMLNFTLTSQIPFASDYWIHGYWGVSRANYALDNLPKVTWTPAVRDRLIGEASFMRAYFYWYLVRIYGGVPIFTSSVQPSEFGATKRASLNECYKLIESDLVKAINFLPEKGTIPVAETGRVSKGAARALLARIYMYQIGTDAQNTTTWQQVYDQTNAVINSGEYTLVPNYAKLWETEEKNNSESIFEVQFGQGATDLAPASIGTNFYNFQGNRKDDSGWGFNNPTPDLVNAYNVSVTNDPRLSCVVYGESFNNGILYGAKKKYDRDQQGSDWLNRKAALPTKPALPKAADRNIKIIRYADVLLMHAEACWYLNKFDEAKEKLNMIRNRARNSTYCMGYAEGKMDYSAAPTSVNLPNITSTGDQLLQDIWKERRLELAMEQLRFYDLVRTGRYLDVMDNEKNTLRAPGQSYGLGLKDYKQFPSIKANTTAKSIDGPLGHKVPLMPIPITEVQAWNLEQNPGY